MAAAAQESAFDPPRWLGVLTAQFGAVLDAGSGSDWESEDEDVLDNEDDVLDEALMEVMEDAAHDVAAQAADIRQKAFCLISQGRPPMGPIVLQVRAQQRLGFGGQRARLVTFFPRTLPLAPITRYKIGYGSKASVAPAQ